MPPTVSAVHTDAKVLLNDASGDIATDAFLLPFSRIAYQELQDELALNSLQEIEEEDSSSISVGIGVTSIAAGTYPADLVMPTAIFEKSQAAGAEYGEPLIEQRFDPDEFNQEESLKYWYWRENEIKLVGATTARYVKIRYIKFLITLTDTSTVIPIINCQGYLGMKVAAMAAFVLGNDGRAAILDGKAQKRLATLIATAVKREQQSGGTRKKPFRAHR